MIRSPRPAFQPFIRQLWVATSPAIPQPYREHTLASGDMHLVIRPAGESVRLSAGDDGPLEAVGAAVVGGVRTAYYVKQVESQVLSVGVAFHPAAARALVGATAEDLAGQHVSLATLWGTSMVDELCQRLRSAFSPDRQLDVLEAAIAERLPRLRALHPAVADALERFRYSSNVAAVVHDTGYSHRTVSAEFRRAMGIGPKAFVQLRRMRRLLAHMDDAPWGALAADAGFSDQSHLVREFRRFTGVTPAAYRRARPAVVGHFKILQD